MPCDDPFLRCSVSSAAVYGTDPIKPPTATVLNNAPIDGFIARHYTRGRATIGYRLFIPPGYDSTKRYPIVVWLHGAGALGDDNEKQVGGDQIRGTHTWTTAENQAAHPAFVMVPQTDNGWFLDNDVKLKDQPVALVLGILTALQTEFSIDPTRIYLSGQSMGGGGAWTLITRKPNPFAAAIILCPVPSEPSTAANAIGIPIRMFVGAKDDSITVAHARQSAANIQKFGGNIRFTEYTDLGHDIWDRVYQEPDLGAWLFAQHK